MAIESPLTRTFMAVAIPSFYLIAHGDDPQTKQNPRFNDKTQKMLLLLFKKF